MCQVILHGRPQAEIKAGSVSFTPFAGVYTFEGNEYNLKPLTPQVWVPMSAISFPPVTIIIILWKL